MSERKFAREVHARRDHVASHGSTIGSYARSDYRPYIPVAAEPSKPLPSEADYDEWLLMAKGKNARIPFPGCKLRRAVIMRRRYSDWAEIGRAIGYSGHTVKYWYEKLPEFMQ